MNNHSGIKLFVCEACGASYSSKHRFVGHLKAKHPEIRVESVVTMGKQARVVPEQVLYNRNRKKRSTNSPSRANSRKSVIQNQDRQEEEYEVQVAAAHPVPVPGPAPLRAQYPTYAGQQQVVHAYGNYHHLLPPPPRQQMLADPREWSQWQAGWQAPAHQNQHQPYYQYHPQNEPER